MAYEPHMIKVNKSTWVALKAVGAEIMESASKGRRSLPDLQIEGVSIDYVIRCLLLDRERTKARRKKADQKRTREGRRKATGPSGRNKDATAKGDH